MSALFNFHSFLTVVLLGICACTYVKMQFPALLEQRTGFQGVFWKAARIGETGSLGGGGLLRHGGFNNLLLKGSKYVRCCSLLQLAAAASTLSSASDSVPQ